MMLSSETSLKSQYLLFNLKEVGLCLSQALLALTFCRVRAVDCAHVHC